jgi:plasmid stabilization system protein ParE
MKVRYTSRARNDLVEIFSHLAKENRQAAQRAQAAILATIKPVAARPYIGIKMRGRPKCGVG